MKQFHALLKKEWQTNRITLLTPLWFTLGVYVIGLFGLIINLIKGNPLQAEFASHNMPAGMESMVLFSTSAGALAAVGSVAMISAVILADSLINGGFKRKCEILHLSQPVSITKILGAKYLFMTLGTIILLSVISLVNTLGISIFLGYHTGAHMYFGITAWAQTLIQLVFTILFVSSMYWFFAGLFKRKSFFMGTLLILGIQAAISILNYTAGLNIPSLLIYVLRLSTVSPDLNFDTMMQGATQLSSMIESKWSTILDIDILMRAIYSAIFCFAGGWLYRNRELS
jgi:ABC-type transport system involved in multi-copper enzyme maturation permease subunit